MLPTNAFAYKIKSVSHLATDHFAYTWDAILFTSCFVSPASCTPHTFTYETPNLVGIGVLNRHLYSLTNK